MTHSIILCLEAQLNVTDLKLKYEYMEPGYKKPLDADKNVAVLRI